METKKICKDCKKFKLENRYDMSGECEKWNTSVWIKRPACDEFKPKDSNDE